MQIFLTGSNQSPFFHFTRFLQGQSSPPFSIYKSLQVQTPVCSIDSQDVYSVVEIFTGSLQVGISLVYGI